MATLYSLAGATRRRTRHTFSSIALSALLAALGAGTLAAQPAAMVRALLDDAAARFDVPRAAIYGVAYNESRWHEIPADSLRESCGGMPVAYGIMGLHDDTFFGHALREGVAIGITPDEARSRIEKNILVGAYRLSELFDGSDRSNLHDWIPAIGRYSGIADSLPTLQLLYADGVLELLRRGWDMGDTYVAPVQVPDIDRKSLEKQLERMGLATSAADYTGASWQPSPNFSSRDGSAVTAIAIHDTEGNFAGSLAWLLNTESQASAHYIVRSVDGMIVQMVRESDKAWHVRNENPYTIGIEHEGYADRPEFYTATMYGTSAALVRYLIGKYNIPLDRSHVKGHLDFPNNTHTDPGGWWDWPGYYRLIARTPSARVVIDRFDDNVVGWWQASMSGSTVGVDTTRTQFAIAAQAARTGTAGAALSYAFTGAGGGVARFFRSGHGSTSDGLLNVGSGGYVTLDVRGDAGGDAIELWFYDNTKGNKILPAGTITWSGWRTISVPISALGTGGPFRFHSIVLRQTSGAKRSGSIAVDDLAHQVMPASVPESDREEPASDRKIIVSSRDPLPASLRAGGALRIVSLLGRDVARFDRIPAEPSGNYLPNGVYFLVFDRETYAVTIND